MLQLLTSRALARAPARAAVSLATLAAIAGAGALCAAPRPAPVFQPDLALVSAPVSAPVSAAVARPVAVPAPTPLSAPASAAGATEVTCLAKAVYYEARGESAEGQAAVAQVVLNRTHHRPYAHSVCGVVFQGVRAGQCQFSFACNGAMDRPLEPAAWSRARRVARAALGGARVAAVGEALSFHVAGETGRGQALARIGGHLFFGADRA